MALLNFNYGLKAKLPSNIVNGNLYVTTDERGLYVDLDSKRIHISDFIELTNDEFGALTSDKVVTSAFYYTTDGNALYKWNGTGWNCLNDTSDLATELAEKVAELNTRIDNVTNSVYTATVNNGATLDQIVAAAGITAPKPGDVLVATIQTTYTESNVEKTCETKAAYGYTLKNGQGQWIAFDGNVNAENVIFTSDLTLTSNVGVHTMPSTGSKTLPTTGKSVKQVMGLLFAEEKNPSTSYPTFTFSATGNKTGEVGTYYSLPTATLKMTSAGSYTYGPATGVHVAVGDASVTASNVADAKTNTTKMVKDSTLAITAAPFAGATTNSSNQVQYTDTVATYNFTASAKYSDGTTPVTNLGNPYNTGKITSANVVDFSTAAGN